MSKDPSCRDCIHFITCKLMYDIDHKFEEFYIFFNGYGIILKMFAEYCREYEPVKVM